MVENFDRERAGALAEKSEEELGMPGGLVLKGNDFDSDSDGEHPPLIGKDHANDSDSDDSGSEWANEEDLETHSNIVKPISQALQLDTKARAPSKSAFVDQSKAKSKRKPP